MEIVKDEVTEILNNYQRNHTLEEAKSFSKGFMAAINFLNKKGVL